MSPNARGEGSACLAITMGHSGEIQRAGMVSIVGIAVFDIVQPNGEIQGESVSKKMGQGTCLPFCLKI